MFKRKSRSRILSIHVVDDSFFVRKSIYEYLYKKPQNMEYPLHFNFVGESFLKRELKDQLPQIQADVLFLDMDLPDGTSWDLIEEIQKKHPELLIVAMCDETTLETQQLRLEYEHMVFRVLEKPFQPGSLYRTVEAAANQKFFSKSKGSLTERPKLEKVDFKELEKIEPFSYLVDSSNQSETSIILAESKENKESSTELAFALQSIDAEEIRVDNQIESSLTFELTEALNLSGKQIDISNQVFVPKVQIDQPKRDEVISEPPKVQVGGDATNKVGVHSEEAVELSNPSLLEEEVPVKRKRKRKKKKKKPAVLSFEEIVAQATTSMLERVDEQKANNETNKEDDVEAFVFSNSIVEGAISGEILGVKGDETTSIKVIEVESNSISQESTVLLNGSLEVEGKGSADIAIEDNISLPEPTALNSTVSALLVDNVSEEDVLGIPTVEAQSKPGEQVFSKIQSSETPSTPVPLFFEIESLSQLPNEFIEMGDESSGSNSNPTTTVNSSDFLIVETKLENTASVNDGVELSEDKLSFTKLTEPLWIDFGEFGEGEDDEFFEGWELVPISEEDNIAPQDAPHHETKEFPLIFNKEQSENEDFYEISHKNTENNELFHKNLEILSETYEVELTNGEIIHKSEVLPTLEFSLEIDTQRDKLSESILPSSEFIEDFIAPVNRIDIEDEEFDLSLIPSPETPFEIGLEWEIPVADKRANTPSPIESEYFEQPTVYTEATESRKELDRSLVEDIQSLVISPPRHHKGTDFNPKDFGRFGIKK